MHTVIVTILGLLFGLVLSRSGAADYGFIQDMFLLRDFQLYGIIGTAVAVTLPGILLLKRYGKTVIGEPLNFSPKPHHRGNIVGGILFGIGWAITGMCPGPIIVNLGEGKLYAIAAFAGVMIGTYAVGATYPRLVELLRLPPLIDP